MVKMMALLYKRPDISEEEFYRYWKEIHAPLVAKLPLKVARYVQNRVVKMPGIDPDLLGIAEIWYGGADSFEEVLAWRNTDEAKHLMEIEESFVDKSRVLFCAVEEDIIVE